VSKHDRRRPAGAMTAPPWRPGQARPPAGSGRRWRPQVIALVVAIAGSAFAWGLAALPLGLWADPGLLRR
jgi:hypothetical protein